MYQLLISAHILSVRKPTQKLAEHHSADVLPNYFKVSPSAESISISFDSFRPRVNDQIYLVWTYYYISNDLKTPFNVHIN